MEENRAYKYTPTYSIKGTKTFPWEKKSSFHSDAGITAQPHRKMEPQLLPHGKQKSQFNMNHIPKYRS